MKKMINFIIYEDEEKMRNIYKEVINKFFGNNNQSYKIIELSSYEEYKRNKVSVIDGEKIYLLDIDVPGKTGLELAREIRKSEDWNSQLIVITANEELKEESLTGKMLMLDFISKGDDIKIKLKETIMVAYNILSANSLIQIKQKGEIYQIKCKSILYIEKNLNDNYITIVTKNDKIIFNIKNKGPVITPTFPLAKILECSTEAVLLFVILFTATEPLDPTPPAPIPAPIPIVLIEEFALLFTKAFRTF